MAAVSARRGISHAKTQYPAAPLVTCGELKAVCLMRRPAPGFRSTARRITIPLSGGARINRWMRVAGGSAEIWRGGSPEKYSCQRGRRSRQPKGDHRTVNVEEGLLPRTSGERGISCEKRLHEDIRRESRLRLNRTFHRPQDTGPACARHRPEMMC